MIIASVVLGLGACGKKGGADDALAKMEDFKKQVCACADMACAEKVSKEMDKYMEEFEKNNKDVKPTKEQDEKADKIGDEMSACMKKLSEKAGGAAPTGDKPDEPAPTPTETK
ncbi:MAG TPA: hypothetical protein VFQ53_07660 [Kofleriaceae bacterium]|nr:hypothetical protein [Kofleriaceae bacterium]